MKIKKSVVAVSSNSKGWLSLPSMLVAAMLVSAPLSSWAAVYEDDEEDDEPVGRIPVASEPVIEAPRLVSLDDPVAPVAPLAQLVWTGCRRVLDRWWLELDAGDTMLVADRTPGHGRRSTGVRAGPARRRNPAHPDGQDPRRTPAG